MMNEIINSRLFGHALQSADAFLNGLLPLIVVAVMVVLIIVTVNNFKDDKIYWPNTGMAVGFGMVGCLLGVLIGGSRDPIVSAALPILVTMTTGLLTYYFQAEVSNSFKMALPLLIVSVAIGVGFGAYYSAQSRGGREETMLRREQLIYPIKVDFCAKISTKIAAGDPEALRMFEEYECLVKVRKN